MCLGGEGKARVRRIRGEKGLEIKQLFSERSIDGENIFIVLGPEWRVELFAAYHERL